MLENISWFSQISVVMFRSSPREVFLIVVFSIFSKISSLLALFLPIKIILMIGVENTPEYIPGFLSVIEREKLVIGLCVLAVSFYILHAILEVFIEKLERKGAGKLSKGLGAINRNKTIPKKIFNRVSKSYSELVFSVCVIAFISWLYPSLFMLVIFYTITVLIIHEFLARKHQNNPIEDDEVGGKIWFDIGFLIAFIFIVWQLLNYQELSVITAFICFLLLRQSSSGLKRLVNDFSFINKQRNTIEHIIKHNQNI
ncbi:MAG: hypothetical protein JJU48_10685 [Methylophaga sp.]|nr:hypothetical protein [Methylophaga sp.]